MADSYRPYRAILLVFAGIASILVSAYGLFTGAWVGGGRSVTEFSFWFLPSLSLPVFIISLKLRRVALLCSCLIPFGIFLALFAENLRGRGTDFKISNASSVALGLMVGMYGVWIALAVMPVCLYFVCMLSLPQIKAGE